MKFFSAPSTRAAREYDVRSADVLDLAARSGCTAYDCEFIYLAKQMGIPLITSDGKLLTAFPDIAVAMDVFIS